MFRIYTVTSVLSGLILMPISLTILCFFLPPSIAFLLSGALCLIPLGACWLYSFKLKAFVYKIITLAVSISLALIVARISIGAVIIAALCISVFTIVKSDIDSDRDSTSPISLVAIILNIPLALINVYSTGRGNAGYTNAAITISTITAIILLILKQADESRRFGQNNMDISTTQKKNNRIFAITAVVLLLVISSIGQVSNIYRFAINVIVKALQILEYLLTSKSGGSELPAVQMQDMFGGEETRDPSFFDMILQAILSIMSIVIAAGIIGFAIYFIVKTIIKLVRRLISWFRNGEQVVLRFSENGHIDERQSLYNKNLKNMAKKLHNLASNLFDREIPYNKLPNEIAKIRRLFKNYRSKAQQIGLECNSSVTAKEICHKVTEISPETSEFNKLMSKCYNAARYGENVPLPNELQQLESKLLK